MTTLLCRYVTSVNQALVQYFLKLSFERSVPLLGEVSYGEKKKTEERDFCRHACHRRSIFNMLNNFRHQ